MSGNQILKILAGGLSVAGAISLYCGWIEFGNKEHYGVARSLTTAGMGLIAVSVTMWFAVAD